MILVEDIIEIKTGGKKMKTKEFMEQKACDMTVEELSRAMLVKIKQNRCPAVEVPMTFAQEIKAYPERFERLTEEGWEIVKPYYGVSDYNNTKILNTEWNHMPFNNKVFYVEFEMDEDKFKEIIRRK